MGFQQPTMVCKNLFLLITFCFAFFLAPISHAWMPFGALTQKRLHLISGQAGEESGAGFSDGTVSSARFNVPSSVAIDSSGNIYVADTYNHTIRKITPAGVVTTFAGTAGASGSTDGTGAAAGFNYPFGVAVDSSDNIYVSDSANNTIRKITSAGVVTTLAGTAGASGSTNGTGAAARFNNPSGITVDSSGNAYVSDTNNHTIRKITPAGVVTTLAGTAGAPGSANGTGAAARFYLPQGVAVDGSGNLYVADYFNYTVRKITSAAAVTTLAGTAGAPGSANGTGAAARFFAPYGIAVDSGGNVYVADKFYYTIRKITPAAVVTTFAGTATAASSIDGTGAAARFYGPTGIAIDSGGNLYVADSFNSTIRKITPAAVVTTFSGAAGAAGATDGTGSAAKFYGSSNVALDSSGNVYVADKLNHMIRKITPAGVVTTFAGAAGTIGSVDGTGTAARFNNPTGIAIDSGGNLYVTDTFNRTVRKITSAGVVTTLAGTATAGASGSTDGTGAAARFSNPSGIAVDSSGNVYVADISNHTIRKITPAAVVTTFAGTAPAGGSTDGTGAAARFNLPTGVAVDSSGNVYVADNYNYTIRKITSAGVVTTLAGKALAQGLADGTGAAARFNYPFGVAVDSSDNIYVADSNNNIIRKITPAGVVTTLAGYQPVVTGSTDATGTAARFNRPWGVGGDSSGNVYVADSYNNTIRKITSAGVVTTFAGTAGVIGSTDATGAAAEFNFPSSAAVDSGGNVYVADSNNNTIRKITPAGVVTTFAGTAGIIGSTDGTGATAAFDFPSSAAVDSGGNVYVADTNNNTIRKITPAGVVTTLAGSAGSSGSTDATGSAARFNSPFGVTVDSGGNVYVADSFSHTIRKITPAGVVTTLAGSAGASGSADGTGSAARFNNPSGVTVDGSGNLYVADTYNNTIRKITPAGVVTTLVGDKSSQINTGPLPARIVGPLAVAYKNGRLYFPSQNTILWVPAP